MIFLLLRPLTFPLRNVLRNILYNLYNIIKFETLNMRKLIRLFYRIFIKTRFIRWILLLTVAIIGVKWATDKGFAGFKQAQVKRIFTLSPADITHFTIQQPEGSEIIFARQDSLWLITKNNVIVAVPEDSIRLYLNLFQHIERLAVRKLGNLPSDIEGIEHTNGEEGVPHTQIYIYDKSSVKHSLSIFYTAFDTLSNEKLTFIKIDNERLLNGVRGEWFAVLNKNFDAFRNHDLLRFPNHDITSLSFKTPLDSFAFFKSDTTWLLRGNRHTVNQKVFKNVVENLFLLRGSQFYDEDRDLLADRKITHQVLIKSPTDSVLLTAFQLDNYKVIHTSQNKDVYFKIDSVTSFFLNIDNLLNVQ